MTYRHIAGVDPSVRCTGYCAPDQSTHRITPTAGPDQPGRRLDEIERMLAVTIKRHPPKPDLVVIEGYSIGSHRSTLLTLGEAGGVMRAALFRLGCDVMEVPPASLKRFATGRGNATKQQMIQAAIDQGVRGSCDDNEADAYHLARMGRIAHGLEQHQHDYELDAIANLVW